MRAAVLRIARLGLLAVVAGVLGVAAGFGTATAYFEATGVGDGTGDTAPGIIVSLAPGTVSPGLYPGSTARVDTVATNANNLPVRIAALALDTGQGSGGFAVDPDHVGCGLATFSFPTQTNGGAGWTVPADGSLAISLPASVAATAATGNACQGATLTVHLRATT